MAHQQLVADVHPDELSPPKKCCYKKKIHYSFLHSTSSIPYPRFTKIIIGHFMTNFPEISRRVRDKYHNMKDDDLMKNIFSSGRYKDKVGMKIPDWMISEEMKQTEHYRMYTEVFGIDVPLIQSPPIESTKGTHRTPSAPRSPTSKEARENVALVEKHLAFEEIEKMVEGQEHVVDDSSIPRNDEHNIPGTRLEPKSDKEREGKNVEESRITPFPTPIRSLRIHTDLISSDTEKLQELTELQGRYGYLFEHLRAKFMPRKSFVTLADHIHEAMADSLPTMVDKHTKEQVEKQVHERVRNQVPVYVTEGLIMERQNTKEEMENMIAKAILQECGNIQAQISSQIQQTIANDIPSQVDAFQQDIAIWVAFQIKFERLQVPQTTCRTPFVHPRYKDDPHDDAHPEGEKSAKRQKTSEYEAYVSGESSSGHDNKQEQGPSTSGNQEQADDYDIWTDSYALDDDEIPTKQVSQGIMEEMKNFLKCNIVWESRKEILVSPHPRKTTPFILSCQRDLEAPTLSLINQDLLYLKKGNSRPEKIVLSLYKFPAVVDSYKRANDCIISITESDFKNLNKNDIEDMYLLIINEKVPDYAETGLLWSLSIFIRSLVIWKRVHDFQLGIESYQQKVNFTAPTIFFPEVEKHEMFSIIYEPVHGIIYKNSKKEKRVMRY
nr:hypothetical protein [Tanacetum cinerariifolium]